MKRPMRTLATLILLTAVARADLKYKSKITHSSGLEQTIVTMVSGSRQREERTAVMGPLTATFVTLTLCDQKQCLVVDDDLKIYAVRPLGTDPPESTEKPGKGTLDTHYTVIDKGPERVKKLDAHHWMVKARYRATGCAGTYDVTKKTEIWTAPFPALNCPELWQIRYDTPGCQVKLTVRGDVAKMQKACGGMVVKKVTAESTTEMIAYSTTPLSPALFQVGKDYQKVSLAEFRRQQQHKLTG